MPLLNIKINTGGGEILPFLADDGSLAGIADGGLPVPDTSSLSNPAPAACYQTVKYFQSKAIVVKTGFAPNAEVTLRYHTYSTNPNNYEFVLADENGGDSVAVIYTAQGIPAIYELRLFADAGGTARWSVQRTGGYSVWSNNAYEMLEKAAAPPATVYNIQAADLTENLRGVSDASSFSRATFQTSATSVNVGIYTNIFAQAASLAKLLLKVNDVFHSFVQATATGDNTVTVALPAGTNKKIEITNGIQDRPGLGTVQGTWLKSVQFNQPATVIQPTNSGDKILFLTDSIGQGSRSSNGDNLTKGFIALLRARRTNSIAAHGWGYHSIFDATQTATIQSDLVSRIAAYNPKIFIIETECNDYRLSTTTPGEYQTRLTGLVDAVHAALPNTRIVMQTSFIETVETTPNSLGFLLEDYRNTRNAVKAARSFTEIINGKNIFTTADLFDDAHPTDAGHIKIADAYSTFFAATPPNTKRIRAFWGASAKNPTGYKLQKIVNGGVPEIIDAGNNREYFDPNVNEGDALSYKVAAYNGAKQSPWSAAVQKTFTNN